MKLVFLYGRPGVGKLTVARRLCERLGLRLFHNHLAVDLLMTLFEFGSEPFVTLREQIWLSVFSAAARNGVSLVFTFAPERTVTARFIPATIEAIEAHGGTVLFVELTCSREEMERRVEDPSREAWGKLSSREGLRHLEASGALEYAMPVKPALRIDTTLLSPEETASRISEGLSLESI